MLGLKLTGSYLGYQLERLFGQSGQRDKKQQAFRQKASRQVREELAKLKGPAMKVGQALSMAGEFVSDEVVREMTELQMHAPPMHSALARAQFKGSCGKYPEEVFEKFEPQPFAAASLGQVHRAITREGDQVAVKIQYPAIRKTIENDFKLLRSATLAGQWAGYIPKPVIDEVESGVLKEVDYLNEGRNIELFAKKLRSLDFVHVPKVFWPYTTERVLTMSLLPGKPLHEFLAGKPSQEQRNKLGERLLKLFLFQIHQAGIFHADPHPGNYLFTDEGRINLVDFGCVQELTPKFAELIEYFLERAWLKGPEHFDRMMQLIWGEHVELDKEARRILELEIELLNLVFPGPDSKAKLVNFKNTKVFELGLDIRKETLKGKLAKADYPFYARAELGLYNMLHLLGSQLDTNQILDSVRKGHK